MGKAHVLVGLTLKPDKALKEPEILCKERREVSGWNNVNSTSSVKRESLHSLCRNRTP